MLASRGMRPLVTVGLAAALSWGCTASAGSVDTRALVDRLIACGLATPGAANPHLLDALYVPDACYAGCLAAGHCDELEGLLCGTSVALPLRCDGRCAFACADGALVAVGARCNGASECADGSDEAGCPTRACADGRALPSSAWCNGREDCPRGEDEDGCPGYCASLHWARTDHLFVGSYYRCDGYAECDDARDEAGCGTFRCSNGYTMTFDPERTPVCDGYSQCGDGTDEAGCPTLARIDAHCGP